MNRSRFLMVLAGLVLSGPAWGQMSAEDVFVERSTARQLDDRCGLFSADERTALDTGWAQSRNQLLQGGYPDEQLDRFDTALASETRSMSCHDREVLALQQRVHGAYAAWSGLIHMRFPGSGQSWDANRMAGYTGAGWQILQDQTQFKAGLARIGSELAFTIAIEDSRDFSSVALIVRDTERHPGLFDPSLGGLVEVAHDEDWVQFTPPDSARRVIWASTELQTRQAPDLFDTRNTRILQFPDSVLSALSNQDPRESVRLDFFDRNGRVIRSHFLEVGDFAAALSFIRSGRFAEG